MADNPHVHVHISSEQATTLLGQPESDHVDGVVEDFGRWLKHLKEELSHIFKNFQADAAASILSLIAKHSGDGTHGAFSDLRIKNGPNKDDKIVIIGAGPAGIHMAYQLKMEGYQNVVVLEKSDRVGGKSYSLEHKFGVKHELGSCYMSPDYKDIRMLLDAMAKSEHNTVEQSGTETTANQYAEEKVIGRRVFDPDSQERDSGCEFEQWLHGEIRRELNEERLSEIRIACRLFKDSVSYIRLHRRLFGRYESEGFLMAKPTKQVMDEVNCSIGEFLKQHKLLSLLPIFKLAFTLQGYGYLDKTPAIYGLLWVTPQLIVGLVEQMKVRSHLHGIHKRAHDEEDMSRSITVIRNGFQSLWTDMVRQQHIDVRLRCNITQIERSQEGVLIRCTDEATGMPLDDSYDFLIIAAPMKNLITPTPVLDTSKDEDDVFSKQSAGTFVTTLVNYVAPPGDTEHAVHSWFGNISPDKPFAVWSVRDMLKLLRENHGEDHALTRHLPPTTAGSSLVAYQYADVEVESVDVKEVTAKLRAHLEKHRLSQVEVVEQRLWSYFPHFSQEAILDKGVLWKILEMQGSNRTWYIGSSTCFEALNAVVSYNKSLLKRWMIQGEK